MFKDLTYEFVESQRKKDIPPFCFLTAWLRGLKKSARDKKYIRELFLNWRSA